MSGDAGMSDRSRNIVVGVVTSVWAINFAAGLIPQLGYKPDQAINGIFMTIVGSIFAYNAVKGARDRNNPDTPAPDTPGAAPSPPAGPQAVAVDAQHSNQEANQEGGVS